ncbi:MAG: restriction endonuclease subunit S [bacterium]
MQCFKIYSDEIEGRLDIYFYLSEFTELVNKIKKSKITFCPLKEITTKITDGAHHSPTSNPEFSNKYITVKDINNDGQIDLINCNKINDEDFTLMVRNNCKPLPNDILFSKDGTVGKIYRVKDDDNFVILSSLAILRPDITKIIPEFLEFILRNNITNKIVKRLMGGSAIQRIILDNLKEVLIPLPEKKIQNKIVDLMQTAYENKKQKEQKAEKLLNSIDDFVLEQLGIELPEIQNKMCYRVYSNELENNRHDPYYYQPKFEKVDKALLKGKYKVKSLKDLLESIISGQRPKGGVGQIEEGIPSLGGEHVLNNGSIAVENLKYIPEDFHKTQLKSKVKKLDVILVKDGATTGKVGIIPENYPFDEANVNEHVFILRTNKDLNPYYLFAYLKSEIGQKQIKREITGATITGIIRESTENLLIPIPPENIQILIADEYKKRMEQAKQLQKEAQEELEQAKARVERIILEEEEI